MFYCEVTAADKVTVGGGVDGKLTSNIARQVSCHATKK